MYYIHIQRNYSCKGHSPGQVDFLVFSTEHGPFISGILVIETHADATQLGTQLCTKKNRTKLNKKQAAQRRKF